MKIKRTCEDELLGPGLNSCVVALSDGTLMDAWELRWGNHITVELTLPALRKCFTYAFPNEQSDAYLDDLFKEAEAYSADLRAEDEQELLEQGE